MHKLFHYTTSFILSFIIGLAGLLNAQTYHNSTGTGYSGTSDGNWYVRIADNLVESRGIVNVNGENGFFQADSVCSLETYAAHGQPAPGTNGGTFSLAAFMNPSTVANGRIAFFSQVDNSVRNQGIFTADSNGIYSIAIGSGSGGGSGDTTAHDGDVSPLGGNFSGFFGGTVFTPAINDAGDVLFVCDVNGGSSPRGLFLYQSSSQQIIKIAAVGDASPIGGTFSAVGPGSINNNGQVVFLASPESSINSDIFMWDNGTLTKVAAAGDPAPGGGTFSLLGTESYSFQDGTSIPAGPVPDINDAEHIVFRAIISGGSTERGIIVRTGGSDEWYVKSGDDTPAGGTYFDMQAASINESGDISFFADFHPTASTSNSGIFAGSPGSWRKVIVFGDPIDGGQCNGLAFSRNPMQMIDGDGGVVFWTDISSSGGQDRMVVSNEDGSFVIAARKGDPTPIGGTIGSMDAWPSINNLYGTLNAATPGAAGGAFSAHMVYTLCGNNVPVELSSFGAAVKGDRVELNWETATEVNNRGFEIERSQIINGNQNEWTVIGFVKGSGTTTETRNYSFSDIDPVEGSFSYRLKQVDFDGSYSYSNIIEVEYSIPSEFSLSQNYPNPFNPSARIEYSIPTDGFVSLTIYNTLGEKVASLVNGIQKAGRHEAVFNGAGLSSGIYLYRLESNSQVMTRKMMLVK